MLVVLAPRGDELLGVCCIVGIGIVACVPIAVCVFALAVGRDMAPVLEIVMRERMALTIVIRPGIPSTSMSAVTAWDRSSGSSRVGP